MNSVCQRSGLWYDITPSQGKFDLAKAMWQRDSGYELLKNSIDGPTRSLITYSSHIQTSLDIGDLVVWDIPVAETKDMINYQRSFDGPIYWTFGKIPKAGMQRAQRRRREKQIQWYLDQKS